MCAIKSASLKTPLGKTPREEKGVHEVLSVLGSVCASALYCGVAQRCQRAPVPSSTAQPGPYREVLSSLERAGRKNLPWISTPRSPLAPRFQRESLPSLTHPGEARRVPVHRGASDAPGPRRARVVRIARSRESYLSVCQTTAQLTGRGLTVESGGGRLACHTPWECGRVDDSPPPSPPLSG